MGLNTGHDTLGGCRCWNITDQGWTLHRRLPKPVPPSPKGIFICCVCARMHLPDRPYVLPANITQNYTHKQELAIVVAAAGAAASSARSFGRWNTHWLLARATQRSSPAPHKNVICYAPTQPPYHVTHATSRKAVV